MVTKIGVTLIGLWCNYTINELELVSVSVRGIDLYTFVLTKKNHFFSCAMRVLKSKSIHNTRQLNFLQFTLLLNSGWTTSCFITVQSKLVFN